jgi:hypothetical protein
MEFEGDHEDFKVTTKPKIKSYEVPHESFSKEAVEKLMKEDEEHIKGIFGVDVSSICGSDLCSRVRTHMSSAQHRCPPAATHAVEQGAFDREVHG